MYMAYSSLGGQWRGQTNPIMESRVSEILAVRRSTRLVAAGYSMYTWFMIVLLYRS